MDASLLSALSALGGAIIGGLTSLLASFFAQRSQARVQWISQDRTRRQEVYKEFIEEASKCYADALQHDEADIPELVNLFATRKQNDLESLISISLGVIKHPRKISK
jgi:hypothetical protein